MGHSSEPIFIFSIAINSKGSFMLLVSIPIMAVLDLSSSLFLLINHFKMRGEAAWQRNSSLLGLFQVAKYNGSRSF